jgi:hypothetical protein
MAWKACISSTSTTDGPTRPSKEGSWGQQGCSSSRSRGAPRTVSTAIGIRTPSRFTKSILNDRSWREADVGAARDSVTTKSGRFVQLGRTKEGKQTQAFGRPKFACLPNNPLAGSAERQPIATDAMNRSRSKPFSKYPWLWIPAFAGMTGESFRTIYRRYRRCCH